MRTDRELISLYRAGDEEAFREFYGRHRKPLFVYLLSMVRDRGTAEELLQETFCSFLTHLDRLNGTENLRPYLVRTARNRAIDLLRRNRRFEEALQRRAEDPLFRPRPDSTGATDPEELSGLLHRLPDEQREAILLKVFLGMTFREIAQLTGCPESSVVSRYRYGLEKLRVHLGRADRDGTRRPVARP